ncbi:4-alpha-glucanotransferase [bioreactor metagenome]|uniref:4-alpha-glucanotransferase n=1 Tax=bioreactor metagenome TaxID=1076179 RepID=A0A645BXD3_9ZZZZ
MNVLVFAFDAREDSDYLPHNYIRNSVVYTGNHDTQTVAGYLRTAPESEVEYARRYLKLDDKEGPALGFVRGAWASVSYLAVAPMQDLLGLDDSARFNTPSTLGDNWKWRMKKGALTQKVRSDLARLNETYRR